MEIKFTPLIPEHFPLLLKWLETPHVKEWWQQAVNKQNVKTQDANWTYEAIVSKYSDYVLGYKLINGIKKPIHAYILLVDAQPVGYIQYYNAYDFPRAIGLSEIKRGDIELRQEQRALHEPRQEQIELKELPSSLAALDVFIGESQFLGKGIGAEAIRIFVNNYVFLQYKYVLVDPQCKNMNAVYAYESAGFVIIKRIDTTFIMVAHKKNVRLSVKDMVALEVVFKKCFLPTDSLWVFGSRANLDKFGGDIDLYIETNALTVDDAVAMKSKFLYALTQKIGEQKIDVVLNILNLQHTLPIYAVARENGVKII